MYSTGYSLLVNKAYSPLILEKANIHLSEVDLAGTAVWCDGNGLHPTINLTPVFCFRKDVDPMTGSNTDWSQALVITVTKV